MLKKIIRIGLLAMALSTVVTGCKSNDDSVFEKSPNQRASEQSEQLEKLLVDSEFGWKFHYFPEDSALGGFTFLMKFDDQGKVVMVSDFTDEGYTEKESEYEIQLRSTTSLVFTTNTYIHELSDPINSVLRYGRGYEGEFQFRFYGFDDDNIYFRGTHDSTKEFNFIKATAEDWSNFESRKSVMAEIGNPEVAVFRSIEVKQGADVQKYDAIYSAEMRFLEFNAGNGQSLAPGIYGLGVGFSNDGLVIQPAIELNGEKFANFKWDASQKAFVSINSSATSVSIKNVDEPSMWNDQHKDFFFSAKQNMSGFIKDKLIDAPGNSQKFIDAVKDVTFSEIQVIGNNGKVTIKYMLSLIKSYSVTYDAVDEGTHIKLTNGSKNKLMPKELSDLHDILFASDVIYLKKQGYNIYYSNTITTIYSGPITFDTYIY